MPVAKWDYMLSFNLSTSVVGLELSSRQTWKFSPYEVNCAVIIHLTCRTEGGRGTLMGTRGIPDAGLVLGLNLMLARFTFRIVSAILSTAMIHAFMSMGQ